MRRALIVLAAALPVLGLATANAAPDEKWARGKVTAMAGDTLTIDVKGQPMTFTVEKTTEIIRSGAGTKAREMAKEGKTPTLSDLVKVGDNVEVSYTEADGKMLAKVVRPGISAPATTSDEGAKEVKGVVSDVSGTSVSIKSDDGAEMTFQIDSKTEVIGRGLGTMAREKKAEGEAGVKLTDAVAKGDSVEVRYKSMGEMKHAIRVHVLKKGTEN